MNCLFKKRKLKDLCHTRAKMLLPVRTQVTPFLKLGLCVEL